MNVLKDIFRGPTEGELIGQIREMPLFPSSKGGKPPQGKRINPPKKPSPPKS